VRCSPADLVVSKSRIPAVPKGHAARPDGYGLAEGDRFLLSRCHTISPRTCSSAWAAWLELEDGKALRSWAPGPDTLSTTTPKRTESTAGPPGKGLANVVGVATASRGEGGVLAARTLLPYPLTEKAA
jgi:transketolase